MTPPRKVYEKRKEKGSGSKSKLPIEPIQKRAKTSDTAQLKTQPTTKPTSATTIQPTNISTEPTLSSTFQTVIDPSINPTTATPSTPTQPVASMVNTKHEGKDYLVTKVRGIHFKIYPKDIRKFFGFKEERHLQFPFEEEEELDNDELAKVLTGKPNAEWGHKKKLAKNRLTPKFNSLHFLACSQLNPMLNTSEISYERGLLLYAIDKGLRVELGQIIWDNMAALFKTRKGIGGLPFAGFITKYVCKRKVITELGEQVAKPLGPITASSRERSASHKKGKEGISSEEFMEKMLEKWDEVKVKLGEIKDDQYFIKQELQSQGKRIAAMEAKLELLLPSATAGTTSVPSEDPPLDS